MTFSIIGRDARTGALGMAVTSSSPCVAARCIHLRDGVGAVASQNVTDPRLGPAVLDRLETGELAAAALDNVLDGYEHAEFRQLTVLDGRGNAAHFSGTETLGNNAVAVGVDAIAAGNLLANESVPQAMVAAFAAAEGDLEYRLLAALEAGEAAGGEAGEVRSAGLSVVHDVGWRVTDLRIDEADAPIGKLRSLLELWMAQRDDYKVRGVDPTQAPSYGVPGDE